MEIKKWDNRPIERSIEKILSEYGIVRQAWHSQSLIGKDCQRLLANSTEILASIEALF